MNYRAIFRFSLDGDRVTRQNFTNDTRARLTNLGFARIGTSSYECDALAAAQVPAFMQIVEAVANCHQSSNGAISVDHLWLYLDTPLGPV